MLMKKIFVFITALSLVLHVQGQLTNISATEVPDTVKNHFSTTHPHAMSVSWRQTALDYEVQYLQNAAVSYAVYSLEGKLLETKNKITAFDLPGGVYAYIKEHYPNVQTKEYVKITNVSGLVTYGVKLEDQEALFDKKGMYIKTVNYLL